MNNRLYRESDGQQPKGERLGQVTVGTNRDLALYRNGLFIEVIEVQYTTTDLGARRTYNVRVRFQEDGFRKFSDLCNMVIDRLDGVQFAQDFPIDQSTYATKREDEHHG